MYFVCRTNQWFPRRGLYSHTIKRETVTQQGGVERFGRSAGPICKRTSCCPRPKGGVQGNRRAGHEKEINSLQAKIDSLTAHWDISAALIVNGVVQIPRLKKGRENPSRLFMLLCGRKIYSSTCKANFFKSKLSAVLPCPSSSFVLRSSCCSPAGVQTPVLSAASNGTPA